MSVGKQASRVGNSGRPEKRSAFIADKKSKQATASEIVSAIGARAPEPRQMPVNKEKGQGSISPNTNKGRGPRRGNQ